MENSVKITLIIASTIVVLMLLGIGFMGQFVPEKDVLSSRGMAEIDVTPDKVVVNLEIIGKGNTTEEANAEATRMFNEFLSDLVMEGFSRDDVRTVSLNVYEDYEWYNNGRRSLGYRASHVVKVVLSSDESDEIVEVIDAGVDAGALLRNLQFELSQELENAYKAEALKLASEDAKLKAEAILEGQDKEVGELVSVSESNFRYSPWRFYETASMDVGFAASEAKQEIAGGIQPGDRTISASVTAVYKIR